MQYTDVIALAAIYASFVASVFALSFAPAALWRFFKDLSDPNFRNE